MRNKTTLFILLGIIVLAIIGFLVLRPRAKAPAVVAPVPAASGDTADLVSLSVAPGASFDFGSTVTITGSIKGSYFFEGTARGSFDCPYAGITGQFPLTATSDWTTDGPVTFTARVSFPGGMGSAGCSMRLANDNPSGDSTHDKHIDIPIYLNFNG